MKCRLRETNQDPFTNTVRQRRYFEIFAAPCQRWPESVSGTQISYFVFSLSLSLFLPLSLSFRAGLLQLGDQARNSVYLDGRLRVSPGAGLAQCWTASCCGS